MNKIRKVCGTCGSDEVTKDAWAVWDENEQDWVLDNVFDYEYCMNCEGDSNIIDVEILEEDE